MLKLHNVACLNLIDPEYLNNIPSTLLIKRSHLKLLDCVGQGLKYKKLSAFTLIGLQENLLKYIRDITT